MVSVMVWYDGTLGVGYAVLRGTVLYMVHVWVQLGGRDVVWGIVCIHSKIWYGMVWNSVVGNDSL